jgi:hypothetical protein
MLRRDFIRSGTLAAGAYISPISLFASEKIKLAILGTGWWGYRYDFKKRSQV